MRDSQHNPEGKQQRVFVTGLGMISPMGIDETMHLDALRQGTSHFQEVDFFDVSNQRVKTAGISAVPEFFENVSLSLKEHKRLDRGARILLHATQQALFDADQPSITQGTPFIIGTSAGAMPLGEEYYKAASLSARSKKGQFERVEHYQPQRQSSSTQRALGIRTHTQIISNACASGANAIGHAYQMIRFGNQHLALAGGYDALCQMVFSGFDSLQALAESGIPRPFDAHRDGLALGEGGAVLILESEASVEERGVSPIAEIIGYGMATDLHHLTQPHPKGNAAVRSMSAASKEAQIEPREVSYINSHGTGTPLNDVAEANAITSWAGAYAKDIFVSSTKSAMGHLLGGAGAIESAICLLSLKHGVIPASLHIRELDPACTCNIVREPKMEDYNIALTNSFGFGGSNASLIFRKTF